MTGWWFVWQVLFSAVVTNGWAIDELLFLELAKPTPRNRMMQKTFSAVLTLHIWSRKRSWGFTTAGFWGMIKERILANQYRCIVTFNLWGIQLVMLLHQGRRILTHKHPQALIKLGVKNRLQWITGWMNSLMLGSAFWYLLITFPLTVSSTVVPFLGRCAATGEMSCDSTTYVRPWLGSSRNLLVPILETWITLSLPWKRLTIWRLQCPHAGRSVVARRRLRSRERQRGAVQCSAVQETLMLMIMVDSNRIWWWSIGDSSHELCGLYPGTYFFGLCEIRLIYHRNTKNECLPGDL